MRVLVACSSCRRQYDASGLDAGHQFHCYCSALVVVRAPEGHDAAVVRCSSCGAGRPTDAIDCAHCRSSFTLHEQDLHTVCPGCMTRCSDRGRFCHSCGQALTADTGTGTATDLGCPACQDSRSLHSRELPDGTGFLECHVCCGMWLSKGAFETVVKRTRERAVPFEPEHSAARRALDPGATRKQIVPQEKWSYRRCPTCSQLMARRNYGRASGVIIDQCRDHGVWLDHDELKDIVDWLGKGGLEDKARFEKREGVSDKRVADRKKANLFAGQLSEQPRSSGLSSVLGFILRGW